MATLVILPGWKGTKEEWSGIVNQFSDENSVVIELPGFGQTPLISADWGIPEYASYVLAEIEKLHKSDIVFLGHSFGGRITSYIASQNPPWLRGIVLYGAPCIYRPSLKIKLLIKLSKIAKFLHIKRKISHNPELIHADHNGLGKIFRKAINFDQTNLLPKITAKTLILWGSKDDIVSLDIAKEMHSLIPNSDLQIIDEGGHHLHIHNRHIFYAKIRSFLQNI